MGHDSHRRRRNFTEIEHHLAITILHLNTKLVYYPETKVRTFAGNELKCGRSKINLNMAQNDFVRYFLRF